MNLIHAGTIGGQYLIIMPVWLAWLYLAAALALGPAVAWLINRPQPKPLSRAWAAHERPGRGRHRV